MHDARLGGHLERPGALQKQRDQRLQILARELREGAADQELHRDEDAAIRNLADSEELRKVLMLEVPQDPRLSQEPLTEARPRVLSGVVPLDLQGNDPPVGAALRPVDLPHSAGPESVLNLVARNLWNAHG